MSKKIWRNESKVNPGQGNDVADDHHDQHSAPADQIQLQRSKSCGEGRASAPSGELITLKQAKPNATYRSDKNNMDSFEKGFKCGLLCLFIPELLSLEKFECGSWASSAICCGSDEGGDSKHLYFDLPLELIRCSNVTHDDANSPVKAAFVFDNKVCKGILKHCSSTKAATTKKSDESTGVGRHARFSTSCPDSPVLCVSPRLLKAREEFNAFLKAQ
uniref:Uncharacterized protein n=1 Tax=Fagus sylvatica TaxID=28930 RepID=A0A2N9F6G8_FAGSY